MTIQSVSNINKLIDPDAVACALGISAGTLQVWRSTGRYKLPFVKVGGRVMYRAEDIQDFIERRLHDHTGHKIGDTL